MNLYIYIRKHDEMHKRKKIEYENNLLNDRNVKKIVGSEDTW